MINKLRCLFGFHDYKLKKVLTTHQTNELGFKFIVKKFVCKNCKLISIDKVIDVLLFNAVATDEEFNGYDS